MRNALCIFVVSGLCSLSVVAKAAPLNLEAAAVVSSSANTTVTTPVYNGSRDANVLDANALLPVRGRDLPLAAADGAGALPVAPQASTVEAIPTPTAFQAGVFLLLALAGGRALRKLWLAY